MQNACLQHLVRKTEPTVCTLGIKGVKGFNIILEAYIGRIGEAKIKRAASDDLSPKL